jgi:hypothetical protein
MLFMLAPRLETAEIRLDLMCPLTTIIGVYCGLRVVAFRAFAELAAQLLSCWVQQAG